MPNLHEFLKKEILMTPEMQKFEGVKPCSKCEKDSDIYYWDAIKFIMSWTCPDGHENSFKVNG